MRLAAPDHAKVTIVAKIGGRPLGLAFDREGRIVACVAGMGLVRVSVNGEVELLTDHVVFLPLWRNRRTAFIQTDASAPRPSDC